MRGDKIMCKAQGIPSWLRKYAKRYGSDAFKVAQTHAQLRGVPMLDHRADRMRAAHRALKAA